MAMAARARCSRQPNSHRLLAVVVLAAILLLPVASAAAAVVAAVAEGDGVENRSAARQWATGKDEGELVSGEESRGGGSVVEDEFAGNSDPDKLKEQAEGVQKLSADELLKRRMEIKVKNTASGSIL
ncbi:hypothetical protein OsJ_29991 [Oryza sativa Japonica Group]|uniref:Uncharacterized protein n=1 Tax=Oryza sativa subsp. japonica TaxID=39947 RepID=B9G4I9_ORYSJ|nr:hypothetical protein OsJ_29991 [Oryza sativa Japonica Group]